MNATKRRWIAGAAIAVALPLLAWWLGFGEFAAKQLAWRALSRRDYATAMRWGDRAMQGNRQDAEGVFLMARIARKQGRIEDCVQQLKRADVLGFDRERIRRELIFVEAQTGNIERTATELPRLLMEQQGDGGEICEAFANGLLMNGMENEAQTLIQRWSADFPEDPQPDVLLGRLAEFRTRTKDAERHYRTALTKSDKYPPALFGLARTCGELQRWQEALELYQRSVALPAATKPALLGIGRCLRNLGRDDESYEFLMQAAVVPAEKFLADLRQVGEPTENDTLATELGTLEANRGNLEEAIRWLQRAVHHNSKHRAARYQLAKSLQALGEADQARVHFAFLTDLEKKLEEVDRLSDQILQNNDDLEARFRMGVLQLEVGSTDSGLYWLRSVVSRHPGHTAARDLIDKYSIKEVR